MTLQPSPPFRFPMVLFPSSWARHCGNKQRLTASSSSPFANCLMALSGCLVLRCPVSCHWVVVSSCAVLSRAVSSGAVSSRAIWFRAVLRSLDWSQSKLLWAVLPCPEWFNDVWFWAVSNHVVSSSADSRHTSCFSETSVKAILYFVPRVIFWKYTF